MTTRDPILTDRKEPPNLRDAPCCWTCKYRLVKCYYCQKFSVGIYGAKVCDDYEPEANDESR